MADKKHPSVTGLSWHRSDNYSFYTPIDWVPFSWSDSREGEAYGPDPQDPLTIFAVDVTDLNTEITAEDLDILAEGFFESLEALPGIEIAYRNQRVTGKLLQLEAKYSFDDEGTTRNRWVRLFYLGRYQVNMMAQGATPEKYDYWLPWFYEAMMTAKIHRKMPESPFDMV